MKPALNDGDVVFVDPGAYRDAPPRPGDIVLSAHPFQTDVRIVKQVDHLDQRGDIFLIGTNRTPLASTDSRSYGAVPIALIMGKVV